MKRLLHIAMCLVAAFLMVPVEGYCSEIVESESETEVTVECVRLTVSEETIEPLTKIVKTNRLSQEVPEYSHNYTPNTVNANLQIIYCVYRE